MSDDNELNPGPKCTSWESFSICDWNLNNTPAYNSVKMSLLQAYVSITKIDMLYLSETYDGDLIPCIDFDVDVPVVLGIDQTIYLIANEEAYAFVVKVVFS